MFAVIKTGGKQYKVQKDDKLLVEKLEGKEGDKVTLDEVLMIADGKKSTLGEPLIKGAKVEAKVVTQTRGPKITVFKKKCRQNLAAAAFSRRLDPLPARTMLHLFALDCR